MPPHGNDSSSYPIPSSPLRQTAPICPDNDAAKRVLFPLLEMEKTEPHFAVSTESPPALSATSTATTKTMTVTASLIRYTNVSNPGYREKDFEPNDSIYRRCNLSIIDAEVSVAPQDDAEGPELPIVQGELVEDDYGDDGFVMADVALSPSKEVQLGGNERCNNTLSHLGSDNATVRSTDESRPSQSKTAPESVLLTEFKDNVVFPRSGSLERRTVTFDSLHIREYTQVLGDHPCCSAGPPISLGWDYFIPTCSGLALDDYEASRVPRRTRRQLKLNGDIRRQILMSESKKNGSGIDENEIKRVERRMYRERAKANRGSKINDVANGFFFGSSILGAGCGANGGGVVVSSGLE